MVKGVRKYTVNDIVDGKRTLANGSIAGYVKDTKGKRVWRIISSKNVDMSKLEIAEMDKQELEKFHL